MIQIVGILPSDQKQELHRFVAALEQHPRGDRVDGRLVIADSHHGGLVPTMRGALQQYMKDEDYRVWLQNQRGRPVATAGKTFVADDELVTACVCPIPHAPAMLALCGHEVIEIAHLSAERRQGARSPEEHEQNGTTLADEYVAERLRIEIALQLRWPRSQLDSSPGFVSQTEDIERVLERPPYDGPPTLEFWQHWVNVARVWAMVAGRADAGALEEQRELDLWAGHRLVEDNGWAPARQALRDLYTSRPDIVAAAVARVWDPVEAYGRAAWAAE